MYISSNIKKALKQAALHLGLKIKNNIGELKKFEKIFLELIEKKKYFELLNYFQNDLEKILKIKKNTINKKIIANAASLNKIIISIK